MKFKITKDKSYLFNEPIFSLYRKGWFFWRYMDSANDVAHLKRKAELFMDKEIIVLEFEI